MEKRGRGSAGGEAGRDEASRGDNCQVFDMVPVQCGAESNAACSSMIWWYQTYSSMVTCRWGGRGWVESAG